MKRLISLLCALTLALLTALPAAAAEPAAFDPGTDYMARMLEAVCAGDYAGGSAAAQSRAAKVAALYPERPQVDFDELWLLSKIIHAEAGSAWLPAEWKMAVGEVVLNRVASPEFPDTMREVLEQPGQYYGRNNPYFDGLRPSPESADAARRLLEGERVLDNAAVVFQANFPQGSGVFLELRDALLGSTYLCFSIRPELYAG